MDLPEELTPARVDIQLTGPSRAVVERAAALVFITLGARLTIRPSRRTRGPQKGLWFAEGTVAVSPVLANETR